MVFQGERGEGRLEKGDRKTEREGDRETGRQRDRDTERQGHRKTGRETSSETWKQRDGGCDEGPEPNFLAGKGESSSISSSYSFCCLHPYPL